MLAASGEPLIYVVTERRELVIAPRLAWNGPVAHPVLCNGEPVLAAGEVSLAVANEVKMVLELNNMSGHYRPGVESLSLVVEAFEALGFEVPQDVVSHVEQG